jgi:hypothetical protein
MISMPYISEATRSFCFFGFYRKSEKFFSRFVTVKSCRTILAASVGSLRDMPYLLRPAFVRLGLGEKFFIVNKRKDRHFI